MPTPDTLPPLLTVAQVVAFLRISITRVFAMIRRGELVALRLVGGKSRAGLRITRESVLAALVPIEPSEVLR